MSSTKLYTAMYVALFAMATLQVGIEYGYLEHAYWLAFGGIMVLSFVKAAMVAGWYQHLVEEPPAVTAVIVGGLLAALALTLAAAYSIL